MKTLCIVAGIAIAGCSADRPQTNKPDAMQMEVTLDKPAIDTDTPTSTPNGTVAVRGTTNGSRIVVKGGAGDPSVAAALPNGGFCVDATLAGGANTLSVFALKDGLISAPATLTVTMDSAAPIPSNPMCLGMEMPMCVPEDGSHGDCANGKDDDCNGLTDACDPGCNLCVDDALEPNNQPFFVPMVAAGTYDLSLCPCTDDYFAFTAANAGDTIHVKATFDPATIDIDMKLQTTMAAEQGLPDNVAISQTTTGIEEITYMAAAAGTYYLKIYPYDTTKSGSYTLTIY
jgi:hypothetical protein